MKLTIFKKLKPKTKAVVIETTEAHPKTKCYNLLSYNTTVAFIKQQQSNGRLSVYITSDWCVSSSTARHVYMFLEEYLDKCNCADKAPTNRREMQALIDAGRINVLSKPKEKINENY